MLSSQFDDFVASSRAELAALESLLGAGHVRTAVGEARHALSIVGPHLSGSKAILEVGAGLGVLSGFISSLGHRVTALEPGGVGFEERQGLGEEGRWNTVDFRSAGVETLDRSTDGPYDFIFSINVLEHVDNPSEALAAMASVLAVDGYMLHECPNYVVPFEPHFGVPLVPFAAHRSAAALPSKITDTELWASLNFVTAADVTNAADEIGLTVTFEEELLAKAIERLCDDEVFRGRHERLGSIADVLKKVGVTKVVRKLPARWSTPMIFELRHSATV